MATERKPRNQWDSVDASGHDWNSGEDFDPTPRQQATAPTAPATPTQQTAIPATQTARVQQPPQTATATAYPSTAGQANSLPPASYPALTALREQAAQTAQANKLPHVDTSGQRSLLEQFFDSQRQQVNAQVDRGVTQGVNELARVNEDAQEQFQTQRNQIDIDERRALDNRAAYDAARGVRGGIAGEQYSSIMNTAAQNRVTVSKAQTQLANDIYRQIAELRANGEFQKADAALDLSQQYLQQLFQLEQWALQTNLSIDQFNAQVDQWAASYNLQLEQMGLQQYQWEQSFNYQKQRDAVADNQWQQQFNRNVLESDRAYNRGVLESDRAYNRGVLESDRAYDFQVQAYRDQLEQQARENGWRQSEIDLQLRAYEDGLRQQQWENSVTEQQLTAQRNQQLANSGWTKIDNGITPDADELRAMGMSREDASLRASLSRAQMELGITSAQLGIDATRAGIDATRANTEATRLGTEVTRTQLSALNGGTSGATGSFDTRATTLFRDAQESGNPQSYITNNYKRYGFSSSSGLYNDYKNWASGKSSTSGGGMSYEDATAEALAGRWSDRVYNSLISGGMSPADITRYYGTDHDEYNSSGFNDYIHNGYIQNIRSLPRSTIGDNKNPMEVTTFMGYKAYIANIFNRSGIDAAQEEVDKIWNRLGYSQRIELLEYLYDHGMEVSF